MKSKEIVIREVMDIRSVAEYLGVLPDTVYRHAQAKTIPAFKIGNLWRFRKSHLDAWMDEQAGVKPE